MAVPCLPKSVQPQLKHWNINGLDDASMKRRVCIENALILQAVQFHINKFRYIFVNVSPQTFNPLIVYRPTIITSATEVFSIPWSLRTRIGSPNSEMAFAKKVTTLSAELDVAQRKYVMHRENPSMHPCVLMLHL